MEKELLTVELSHHDLAPETITIGIYDTIDEAVLHDYNKTRYMAVDVDHERIGSKEITIL